MQKLRSIGFILVGAVAGVLISLNFQAIADRAGRAPLPIEELPQIKHRQVKEAQHQSEPPIPDKFDEGAHCVT